MSPWQFGWVLDFPRNLLLKFHHNRVTNSWYILDMAKCRLNKISLWRMESVLDVPRNLPLKFHQNWVSNSWDIADIEFLWVGGWWVGFAKSFSCFIVLLVVLCCRWSCDNIPYRELAVVIFKPHSRSNYWKLSLIGNSNYFSVCTRFMKVHTRWASFLWYETMGGCTVATVLPCQYEPGCSWKCVKPHIKKHESTSKLL